MKIISIAAMRALEERAVVSGIPEYRLMRRAGTRAAAVIEEFAGGRFRRVVFFCGGGNNGGDAIVAAASLRLPHVFLPFKELSQLKGAASEAFKEFGHCLNLADPASFDFEPGDLIVDALLGIGFTGDTFREPVASALTMIRNSRLPVVAFDLPSGMNGDTGKTAPGTVKAALTLTFGFPKQGMFTSEGKNYCGKLSVIPIGVEKMTVQGALPYECFTAPEARQLFPVPALEAHKNSCGRVLLLCGSMQYPGAACLAAKGALYFSGLVRLLTVNTPLLPPLPAALICRQIHADVTGALPPETLETNDDFLSASDVLCAGCGWGSSVSPVLLKKVLDFPGPVVLDADGLNVLSRNRKLWNYRSDAVLTPHPGEAARLAAAFGIAPELEREELTAELARRLGATVVLKGFHTCVGTPDGKVTVNCSGGPELAMAGSGDVLAGMIAALIARTKDIPAAVRLGVYLHGASGDAGHGAVIADDLPALAAERAAAQIWW
jgi:NAD(P)H-hydrate epimerase